MKSELDVRASFATGDQQNNVPLLEFEEGEIATDFTSLCQNMYALYPENVTNRYLHSSLMLNIESEDGSELLINIGESPSTQESTDTEARRNYIVFAHANYYGHIEDTYKYKVSEDGRTVIRLTSPEAADYQDGEESPIGKAELQKVRELLLLGTPRYDVS